MYIEVPDILKIPEKLTPLLYPETLAKHRYFLLEGGRGSSKSQTIGRLILYLCSVKKLRVVCGRELQANIEESVYTLLKDLIDEYGLDDSFKVMKTKIENRHTGSEIKFKGFREHGSVNIKGLEGVDLLWIDEAQSITEKTLQILIPTIRKNTAKVFFSMNRFLRSDPVFETFHDRHDCWYMQINYVDNEYCPESLKIEAEALRKRNETEYNHVWLGEPLSAGSEYLFGTDDFDDSFEVVGDGFFDKRQRVCSLDFAAEGGDLCVYTILDREGSYQWGLTQQITWGLEKPMSSIGRVVNLLGQHKPDVFVLDCDGMGEVVADRLRELKIEVITYKGSSTKECRQGYLNNRADGYFLLKEWMSSGWLRLDRDRHRTVCRQLEGIKLKWSSGGKKGLLSKKEMRAQGMKSPDEADSLMMAVWAAVNYLGGRSLGLLSRGISSDTVKRRTSSRRSRRGY